MKSTLERPFIDSEHEFYYQTNQLVTARALADSLIGLDGVVQSSRDLMSVFMGAGAIVQVDVLIQSVTVASYKDNFLVRMFFGDEKVQERNIEKLRKALGLKLVQKMQTKHAVAAGVVCAVGYVAWQYSKPADTARVQIQNSFINIGAGANLKSEDVLGIVDTLVDSKTKRDELKRRVSQLVHPGGTEHTGSITLDGDSSLTISPEIVKAIPVKAGPVDVPDPVAEKDDTEVILRALDLDSSLKGWYAICPEISDARLPIQIAPEVDALRLPVGQRFQGDVTVVYSVDRFGNKKPRQFILRKRRTGR
jgi:hypothetical protein